MKKYKVKALFDFDDVEEKTKRLRENNEHPASIWTVTKERYEFLKDHNAVELIEVVDEKEIDKKENTTEIKETPQEEKDEIEEEIKEIVKSRKRRK